MFCRVVKRLQLLLINIMVLLKFWVVFRKWHQNVFIFDRFYKGFTHGDPACAKTLQDQCFFDDLQNRETSSTFTDKPNAFLILPGAILRKGARNPNFGRRVRPQRARKWSTSAPQKTKKTIGKTAICDMGSCLAQNLIKPVVY